ncbi:hypothetical protein BDV30DRAFT_13003 [Aspergillus minisclerotigenes]|uniref:Uncharacterized protein n=1 Tax=Aspergillus minisclerotigenes TaxID=656917 RepID=A0A5N6IPZ1_9EURO|nr:hypothetical protein BDV30DRAFT_13003 [Aspergillus minisclerotigenes]
MLLNETSQRPGNIFHLLLLGVTALGFLPRLPLVDTALEGPSWMHVHYPRKPRNLASFNVPWLAKASLVITVTPESCDLIKTIAVKP